ncbi:hypothetical protein ACHQM5_014168 [Ranunculus cassubicifolius]
MQFHNIKYNPTSTIRDPYIFQTTRYTCTSSTTRYLVQLNEYTSLSNEMKPRQPDTSHKSVTITTPAKSSYLTRVARALLGRLEYHKGNVEGALRVFDGIDIASVTPKIIYCIASKLERRRRRSKTDDTSPLSVKDVSLLMEAIYLKANSFQTLGRHKEAAQTYKVILDTIESALPEGVPDKFGADCKLQEILNKAVELLPESWKLAGYPQEAILSYRRALLHHWNLDKEATTKIQKEFAILLLYGGTEATPPGLRSQIEGSFVPTNNVEEAVLLLMILLRKIAHRKIEWDPSILGLASQVEGLLPGVLDRKERYYTLALCYHGKGENSVALDLLRKLLKDDNNNHKALLVASKICSETPNYTEEGVHYARRAVGSVQGDCNQLVSLTNRLLGVSLSAQARCTVSDSERTTKQSEALVALETAEKTMRDIDPNVLYHVALENAELRKLDIALYYAEKLLKLEAGSNLQVWILLVRILSAQNRFVDAETLINVALEETGRWEQGELLRTKAKLQIAQGQLRNALETYTHLLAVLQVKNKSFNSENNVIKGKIHDRNLELEIWHDLADVYMRMSEWRDAEVCLSKSESISPHSAARWHMTEFCSYFVNGLLNEAKGNYKAAVKAFTRALDVDPDYVPSLVSTAIHLRKYGNCSTATVRSYLMNALRLDKSNYTAWYNLGLLYKDEGGASLVEAAECFEAAAFLEESAPVQPFR